MHETDARILRYIGYGTLIAAGLWLLYRIKDALPVFVLGLLLAYIADPWLDRLQARGWSRSRAVRFVFLCFFGFILMVACVIIPLVVGQVEEFSRRYNERYKKQIADLTQNWQTQLEKHIPSSLKSLVFEKVEEPRGKAKKKSLKLRPMIVTRLESLRDSVGTQVLSAAAGWMQSSISGFLLLLVLPLIVYYFMNEIDPLRQRVVFLIPETYREKVVAMSSEVNRLFGRYIRGQFIVCLLYAVSAVLALTLWSFIFGMRYTFALGLLAGVLYVIPYVGMIINFALAATIGYLTGSNPVVCALCAGGSLVVLNFLSDNLVVPRVVGKELGLHPLTVLFALLAGGQFGGILGMVVAVPVAGAIKAVLLHLFPQLAAPIPESVQQLAPATPTDGARAVTSESMGL